MYATVAVAADTDPAAALDLITQFGPYGIVGTVLGLILLRKGIVPEWVLRQAEERHAAERTADLARIARLEAALEDSNRLLISEVVPALTQSTAVLQRTVVDQAAYRDDLHDDLGGKPRGGGRGR